MPAAGDLAERLERQRIERETAERERRERVERERAEREQAARAHREKLQRKHEEWLKAEREAAGGTRAASRATGRGSRTQAGAAPSPAAEEQAPRARLRAIP